MLNDLRVLSARRAYEFPADALRLTTLTTKPVQEAVQQTFHFQLAQVATPIATFGDVPGTIPPGLVFNYGLWTREGEVSVPIRLLHIEQKRIVIDVAGPSAAIAGIYEQLRYVVLEIARALNIAGDAPVLGEPERTKDYSEITAQCSWRLDSIFAPGVGALFAQAAGIADNDSNAWLAPTVYARPQAIGQESPGTITIPDSRVMQFSSRMGTRPEEQVHFSGAALDTEAHIAYLRELDAILTA